MSHLKVENGLDLKKKFSKILVDMISKANKKI